MFHRARPLSILATATLAVCAASEAPAQAGSRDRDAKAFPCAAQGRLTVVQDQQGFSITNAKPDKAAVPAPARVSLGANLKLDRALFVNSVDGSKEASDAPRR